MFTFRPITKPLFIVLTLAFAGIRAASAIDLPAPADLMAKYGMKSRNIRVIEPHESTPDHAVTVSYQALPMADLLTHWFGDSWKMPGSEVVFLARDGYRSVVTADKLSAYKAFLAFARTDGMPFVVDNIGQNQTKIPLGPYYMIWDNLGVAELLSQGAYGWPYQIKSVELLESSENQKLQTREQSSSLNQGLADTKTYCLTCHRIRGVGGKKYSRDLLQAACQWNDADLKAFIESPSRFNTTATMPALGRMLPLKERRMIIERIVSYLQVLQNEEGLSCAKKSLAGASAMPKPDMIH